MLLYIFSIEERNLDCSRLGTKFGSTEKLYFPEDAPSDNKTFILGISTGLTLELIVELTTVS